MENINKLKAQSLINDSKANEIESTIEKIESNKKDGINYKLINNNSNYDENNNRKRKVSTDTQSKSAINNYNKENNSLNSNNGGINNNVVIAVSSRFKTDICEHYLKDECHYNKPLCRYAHGFYDLHCPYPNGVAVKGYDIHKYKSKTVFEDLFQCDLKSTEIHKTFAFVFLDEPEDVEIILKFNNYTFRDVDDREYSLEVFQPPLNKVT